jgi:hypothetical protein
VAACAGLVSRPSAERRSRTEREPGSSATTRAARYSLPACGSFVSPLGPRKSGLADLPRLTADLGQARDRCLAALAWDTRVGRAHDACEAAAREANRWPSSRFTMSNSTVLFVPAARCCARVGLYPFAPDPKRGGRSADRRTIAFVAFARRDRSAQVRRGASHDAGRSPLGAPPWRFSAGGRASISGISSGSVQRRSSQPGRHAWRAVSRTSRARGYEPRPQELPAPPSGSSLEDAPP